jgi:dihydrodipicolinate synthase/N-acetylneuraminate lyase
MGADGLTLAALELGSDGTVPALANVRPDLFVALIEAAGRGNSSRAAEPQDEVARTRETLRGRGIATLKHAVAERTAAGGVR